MNQQDNQPNFPEVLTRTARSLWDTWRQHWPPPEDEHGKPLDQPWERMPEEARALFLTMARNAAEELGVTIDD